MAEDPAVEDEDLEDLPLGNKPPMLLVMLVAVNMLMTIGVLAVVLLKEPAAAPPAPAKAEGAEGEEGGGEEPQIEVDENGDPVPVKKAIRGPIEKLADIVIQLRNPEFDRFARISFEMELATADDLEFVQAYKPRIRDAFIGWLSDRSYEELRGSRGLAKTKTALAAKIEEIMPGGRVQHLYITNFVVQ